jgi:hypothetical protein
MAVDRYPITVSDEKAFSVVGQRSSWDYRRAGRFLPGNACLRYR